ncbi:ATP-dependent helicase, partial [Candidatus Peregrinibacteria bacterium]|nr:ATP-dependent helicase [Candidatus Peregrinibacteria bacterium]
MKTHSRNEATLNPEQLSAVTHGEGPLLIIAGAGTGKTHVLASRILYLIQEKKVNPQSILALTFTEKANSEMRERLDLALPLGYEELPIYTFHGFSDSILREKGLLIGLPTDYRILTAPEQWLFVKNHLFEFELSELRPLGNPTKLISTLLAYIDRLRDECISPETFESFAKRLPKDTEEFTLMNEIAHFYQTYQHLKIKNGCLDFQDLTFYVLQLFQHKKDALTEYQNRYQYILVDEFQDTNFAQNSLVELLAKKHRNITVVGDDDQSIYKWRGASLANILSFEKIFPGAKKVVLTRNYRSSQNILTASHAIIQNNNPNRLEVKEGISKHLIAENTAPLSPITVIHAEHSAEETEEVVNEIERLHDVPDALWSDSAILVRANKHALPFIEECRRRGIPCRFSGSENLLSREEIKDMWAVIRICTNPADDISLFRILSMPIFGIPMVEITLLLSEARKHFSPLFTLVMKKGSETTLALGGNEKWKFISGLLTELLEESRRSPVSRVLGNFLEKSGYLRRLIDLGDADSAEKIQGLSDFSTLVKKFESDKTEANIFAFEEYLELIEESGISREEFRSQPVDSDAVKILTIHASKGLEFPNVFIVNLVQERFPSRRQNDPFKIPEELLPEALPAEDTVHLEEERRLFYVACTRAQKKLFLAWSDCYEHGKKKWKKSVFVEEMEKTGLTVILSVPVAPRQEVEGSLPAIQRNARDNDGTRDEIASSPFDSLRSLRAPRNDINRLSFSQIDMFQTCPYKYTLGYLWRVPTPPSHAASFGSSVHNTLNAFYKILMQNPSGATKETLKTLYEQHWISAGYMSRAHENTRKKNGWEMLEAYFEKNRDPWVIPAFLECNFVLKLSGKGSLPSKNEKPLLISGRIDRIDKLEDGYEVIDYKTGRLKKESDLKKDLQLSIYALACRDIFGISASKLSLYFLEDNVKVSATRTAEDLEKTKEQLLEIAENMQNSDFPATPGYKCQFCDYRLLCYAV